MIVPLVRTAPVAIDKHAGNLAFLSGLGGQNLIIERTMDLEKNPIEAAIVLDRAESELVAEEGRLNHMLDTRSYDTLTGRERCHWMVVADLLGEYRRDRDSALRRWVRYQVERNTVVLRIR